MLSVAAPWTSINETNLEICEGDPHILWCYPCKILEIYKLLHKTSGRLTVGKDSNLKLFCMAYE